MTHSTFCEHIVKQKCQGKFLIAKILLGALYGAIAIVPSFIIIMFAPPYLIIPFLLVIASVIFVLFRLTWKYTNVEYEYQVIEDSILFTRIIGRSKRVCDIEMPIRAFSLLGAHNPDAEKYLSELLVDRSYLFISSFNAENIHFGVFDAEGETCIVFFEATEDVLAKIRRHNPSAIRAYEREMRSIQLK